MKKAFIKLFSFIAPAMLFASCNENVGQQTDQQIQVNLKEAVTRATFTGNDTKDNTINSIQILVFRGENLDGYKSASQAEIAAKSVTVSCTGGQRTVYAYVNGEDMSAISSLTDFLSRKSLLSNNAQADFEMIGSANVTLPKSDAVDIEVSRFASRVVLKKVTNNLSSPALASLEFKIKSIYLTNAAGDALMSLGSYSPTVWFNKLGNESNNQIGDFHFESVNSTVAHQGNHDTHHFFYTYPNPSESGVSEENLVSGGTFSARRTRLVIEAQIGTKTYYYPIVLPVMEHNKSYEITDLVITRPGSDDPDTPVSYADVTYSVTITPWTTVFVEDSKNGKNDGTILL